MTRHKKYKIGLMYLGLKQKDLAQILCLSECYLSQLMSGERKNKEFNEWMNTNILSKFSSRGKWIGN